MKRLGFGWYLKERILDVITRGTYITLMDGWYLLNVIATGPARQTQLSPVLRTCITRCQAGHSASWPGRITVCAITITREMVVVRVSFLAVWTKDLLNIVAGGGVDASGGNAGPAATEGRGHATDKSNGGGAPSSAMPGGHQRSPSSSSGVRPARPIFSAFQQADRNGVIITQGCVFLLNTLLTMSN